MDILFLGAGRLETGSPRETNDRTIRVGIVYRGCEQLPSSRLRAVGSESSRLRGFHRALLPGEQCGQCRRCLPLGHSTQNHEARRSRQDAATIHAGLDGIFIRRYPLVGVQIVEKTHARNVGGLAVVADAFKVVRAGAAAGEMDFVTLSAAGAAEARRAGMWRPLAPFNLIRVFVS